MTLDRRDATTLAASQDARGPRILARTLFKDLTQNGMSSEQILAVASEMIALVTHQIREHRSDAQGNA